MDIEQKIFHANLRVYHSRKRYMENRSQENKEKLDNAIKELKKLKAKRK